MHIRAWLSLAVCLAGTSATLAEPTAVDGLILWLRADDVDADGKIDMSRPGTRIARWMDASGKGNHVRQNTVLYLIPFREIRFFDIVNINSMQAITRGQRTIPPANLKLKNLIRKILAELHPDLLRRLGYKSILQHEAISELIQLLKVERLLF